jgi:hypothetical protein
MGPGNSVFVEAGFAYKHPTTAYKSEVAKIRACTSLSRVVDGITLTVRSIFQGPEVGIFVIHEKVPPSVSTFSETVCLDKSMS